MNVFLPPTPRCRLTGAMATACGDDAVRVFKEEETSDPDQPVFSMVAQKAKAHNQDVNCVAWNPKEEGLLASCSDDGDIAIWRFKEENWALNAADHAVTASYTGNCWHKKGSRSFGLHLSFQFSSIPVA